MATSELNNTCGTPGKKQINFHQKQINKRPVRRNSEGCHMAVWLVIGEIGRLDRDNRRLPCVRCWRKSLKCLCDSDAFHDVFCMWSTALVDPNSYRNSQVQSKQEKHQLKTATPDSKPYIYFK